MSSLSNDRISVDLACLRRLRQTRMSPLCINTNTGFHMNKLTVFMTYFPDGGSAEWGFLRPVLQMR